MSARISPPTGSARYGTPLDRAMRDFERAVVRIDGVDPITTELVRLRCARVHDCRRCSSMRDDAALRSGFDEALGAKIDDYERSDLSPRHKAALRLADAMILTPGAIEAVAAGRAARALQRGADRRAVPRRRQVERAEGPRGAADRAAAERRSHAHGGQPGRIVHVRGAAVGPLKRAAISISARVSVSVEPMLTHSSSACAPAPTGPSRIVGMPAAAMNAESAQ